MTLVFKRGMMTDWLLEMLTDKGLLIGDGIAPDAGGWPSGEPGQGEFVPYTVLSTSIGRSAPGSRGGIASAESWDWQLTYRLGSYGGLRTQADWAADLARIGWDDTREQLIDLGVDVKWKASQFNVVNMGPVNRNDVVIPQLWEVIDDVSVNLTRSRHA